MAEYGSMFAVSGLAAILFFGGWNGPIPITNILGLTYENHWLLGYVGGLIGLLNFLLKAVVGVTVMMWVRWTLPRLRIDQVITTCLKYCVPIAAVCFVGAMFWTVNHIPFLNDLAPISVDGQVQRRGDFREGWLTQLEAAEAAPPAASEETPADAEDSQPEPAGGHASSGGNPTTGPQLAVDRPGRTR